MFCSKVAVFALIPLAAVSALPFEKREPEPGLGDFFGSVFNEATSDVASVFGVVTSVAQSALAEVTASSIFDDATSVLGTATSQAFATIVTANGVPVVEVTSVGGPAITLATQSGTTTSFAGHLFTVATAAPSSATTSSASTTSSGAPSQSSSSAAMGVYSAGISKSVLFSLATVIGSAFTGALVVL